MKRNAYPYLFGLVLLLTSLYLPLLAQVDKDYAPDFRSTPNQSNGNVALEWDAAPGVIDWDVFVRQYGNLNLNYLGTAPPTLTAVNVTGTVVGVHYEFQLRQNFTNALSPPDQLAIAHLSTGTQVPFNDQRGIVLLVTENQSVATLTAKVNRLINDLIGDGWCVQVITCDRTEPVTAVKARIVTAYNANPSQVRAVFLLGRVPVPYSGDLNPDAHPDHKGAWPADGYYGDMDGVWTDATVNTTTAADSRNHNVPGDGKFDQSEFPSDVELWVGRVDFANMPAFTQTEEQLLERYLDKNHAFRHRQVTLQRRALIRNNFNLVNEFPGRNAWCTFQSLVGSTNITTVAANQYFPTLSTQDYLLAYGAGAGSYTSANSVGTTNDFRDNTTRVAYQMLFGSYFGDWDRQNNFLRASIAGPGNTIGTMWAGRPNYHIHMMGMGEPIGAGIRMTMNNRPPNAVLWAGATPGGVHTALMGDPTLRLHPVIPPSNLTAQLVNSNSQVKLDWNPSTDNNLQGYHVYRINPSTNCAVRLTTSLITGPLTFTDNSPVYDANNTYMVRAVKREFSTTGDYFNGSQGIFVTIFVPQPTCAVLNPTVTNVSCNGGTDGSITLAPTGGNPPFSYSWTRNAIPFATTQNLTGLAIGTYAVTVTDAASCQSVSVFEITEPAALTVTLDAAQTQNVTCGGMANPDGRLYVDVAGGTQRNPAPFYTYNWTRNATAFAAVEDLFGIPGGTYALTVTDANGCTATFTHIISEPDAYEVDPVTITPVSCRGGSDGSITLNPRGGTGPYTFEWRQGATVVATTQNLTGAPAGTYTFVIRDSRGCTAQLPNLTITEPAAALTVAVTSFTNETCPGANNGAINITAAGGTGPYTYSWTKNGNPAGTTEDLTNVGAGNYAVTVTDSRGCTATATQNLTAGAGGPTVTLASFTNESCAGANNGTLNITVTGGAAPYTFSWRKDGNPFPPTTQNLTGLGSGLYAVTVTDQNGCTGTLIHNIGIGAGGPTVTLASHTDESCAGANNGTLNITVTGGTAPYTFSWRKDGNPFPPTTQNLTGLGSGLYAVTVTDQNGCTGTLIHNIGIGTGGPTVTVASFTDETCPSASNGTINLDVTGTGPFTFSWRKDGNPFPPATQNLTGLAAGTYAVTVTDANGCTGTASRVIATGTGGPTVTIASTQNPTCIASTDGQIFINVTGTGPFTFNWTRNGNPFSTQEDLAAVGGGTYAVTVTDANGCTGTASHTLTPGTGGPTVSVASFTNESCPNANNGTINLTVTGTGPYTFAWTRNGNPITPTTQNLTGLAGGNYAVTVTDAGGCTATATQALTTGTGITATIGTTTNPACNGQSNGSINLTVAGGTAPYTYSWTRNGNPAGTTQNLTNQPAGNFAVTVTDANNCTGTATTTLTDPPVLAVTLNAASVLNLPCANSSTGVIDLDVTGGTPAYTYNWTKNGNPAGTTQDLTGQGVGTYAVTVTDSRGCFVTATHTITAPAALTITPVLVKQPTCTGAGTDGEIGITVAGGTAPYTYDWRRNGNPFATTEDLANLSAGTYALTVTDANSCTQTFNQVLDPTPTIAVGVTSTDEGCAGSNGGSISLTPSGGTAPYTYAWTKDGNPFTAGQNATGLGAGSYAVTVTDAGGCSGTATRNLTAFPLPTVTATPPAPLCAGQSGNLNASGASTYLWQPGNLSGANPSVSPATTTTYTVRGTDGLGCTASATATVTVNPIPNVGINASPSTTFCTGQCVDLTGTGATSYAWQPGNLNGTAVNVCPTATTTYTVVGTAAGCTASATVTLTQGTGNVDLVLDSFTDPRCNGQSNGSIVTRVATGTGPYTYTWRRNGNPYPGTTAQLTNLPAGSYEVIVTDQASGCSDAVSQVLVDPAPLTLVTVSQQEPLCPNNCDGFLEVAATGGTGPYQYLWNWLNTPTADLGQLCGGTYVVTATDANGCSATRQLVLNEPAPINVTVQTVGTTLTATVTGGTPSYSYQWSFGGNGPSASNPPVGAYALIVEDANGCIELFTGFYGAPPLVVDVLSIKEPSCTGSTNGEICLNVSGGQAPYTYAWSASSTGACASSLAAGTYSVTIADALGQTEVRSFTLNEPQPLRVSFTQQGSPCAGGAQLLAIASGGTQPYTYAWSTGSVSNSVNVLGDEALVTLTLTDARGCRLVEERLVSCCNVEVVNLRALTATPNMIYLAWNTQPVIPPSGTRYQVRSRVVGSTLPWRVEPNLITTPFYGLPGLQAGLCYDIEVRAVCPGGYHTSWFRPAQPLCTTAPFTTCLASPPSMPTGFQVTNVTPFTALVKWNAVQGAQGYLVQLGLTSQTTNLWSTYVICEPNQLSLQLSGLVPNRQYGVRIRTVCTPCSQGLGANALLSAWSQPVPFNTPASRIDETPDARPVQLSVYPNPTRGQVVVRFDDVPHEGTAELVLSDLTGRRVLHRLVALTTGQHEEHLWLEGTAAGLYLLTVRQGQSTQVIKLMVE